MNELTTEDGAPNAASMRGLRGPEVGGAESEMPDYWVQDVVEALRLANLTARGAVAATRVADILSDDDRVIAKQLFPNHSLAEAVRTALNAATAKGGVEVVTRPRGHPLYLHEEARRRLHDELGLTLLPSRRQRTRALVVETARCLGRAVRFCDIIEYQNQSGWANDIERAAIGRDLQSLCRSGEIVLGREVIGGGVDGQYFYLPAEHAPGAAEELPVPDGPASWLEHVLAAFRRCWEAECVLAEAQRRRPRPLATGVLRARLLEETDLPQAREEQLVPNAMGQLAKATPPLVRIASQRKGSHYALWAPADVTDDTLDLGSAFASDTARVIEAAQRAMERFHRPAVGRRELEAEIARDPSLCPSGASSVAALLADASKEMLDAGTGERRRRVASVLTRLGHVAGEAYYAVSTGARSGREERASATTTYLHSVGQRYLDLLRLEVRWRERDAMTQVQQAMESLSAAATVGRLRAVEQGVKHAASTLAGLGRALIGEVPGIDRRIEELQADVEDVRLNCARHVEGFLAEARRLRSWNAELEHVDACGLLEASGVTTMTGATDGDGARLVLTTGDVYDMVRARGYARALRAASATELIPLLSHRLLRLENEDYSGWRRESSEYHFERTDAFLFAAIEWGGGSAVLFGQLARQELGQLRDARFVRAGLAHPRFDARMSSAAALAFLPADAEGDALLAKIALEDPDAGVRRAALWAYGAGDRSGVADLVTRVLESERHRDVIALARGALAEPKTVWWTC